MIADSYDAHKGTIIAKIFSKNNKEINKTFTHFFFACNLLNILFKNNINYLQKSQELLDNSEHILRNRYHLDHPIVAKNPLTN